MKEVAEIRRDRVVYTDTELFLAPSGGDASDLRPLQTMILKKRPLLPPCHGCTVLEEV